MITQRTVIKMKNFSKILCVVLALVIALSAAACSFTQEYAYDKDDIQFPIGVYIYYLNSAYNKAQSYAQESDLYDAETGKYDGSKSFLKMEITDEDGNTAVAEDWIIDKAKKDLKVAVATNVKFNELGCTIDQTELDQAKTYYKSYWDQGYSEQFEPYGISFDSFFMAGYTISVMETEAFKAEYGIDGPSAVSDEELEKYFKDNYVSYKYFSANLYKSETESAGEDGETVDNSVDTALSEDEIAAYQKDFDSYASSIASGSSFDDVISEYMSAYGVEEDPRTENVETISDEETDEIKKTIKDMKDGQAMTVVIGDDENTKQIYLAYREPIEKQLEAYTAAESDKREEVISSMKHEEFDKLLENLAEELGIEPSPACDNYKPSMFENNKKTNKA